MKKITGTGTAIDLFIESAVKHAEGTLNGDHKIVNKHYDKIVEIVQYLKHSNQLHILENLLDHESLGVRICAGTYLLPANEKKAINTLEKIVHETEGIHSLIAETTLREWRKGNLKL